MGERTVAMPSHDGGIPKQLVEHDGILPAADSITVNNYVVKPRMNLSICLGLLRCGHIFDLATLCI